MPRGKRKKRVLLAGALILGMPLLLWLAVPLWFPWILKPLARRQGATYGGYQREGYNRFLLTEVSFTNRTTQFRAQRVEALVPTAWLVRSMSRKHAQPFLRLEGWRLHLLPSGKPGSSPQTPVETVEAAQQLIRKLQKWLPNASLSAGTIEVQNELVKLPRLTWAGGRLRGQVELPTQKQEAAFDLDLAKATDQFTFNLKSGSLGLESMTRVALEANALQIQSTNLWRGNRVDLVGRFGTNGYLPETASLRATNFAIAGKLLGLQGYNQISGSLSAEWHGTNYEALISAEAQPIPTETNWPPAKIRIQASGNTNALTVREASLSSPAFTLELSRPAELHFSGPVLREPARLTVAADASAQPWVHADGRFAGEADLFPGENKYPRVDFRLAGTNVGYTNILVRQLALRGAFAWPAAELSELNATFEDGSRAHITGTYDITNKVISAAHIELAGPVGNRWLPNGTHYSNATLSVSASGPITNLIHSGDIAITSFASPGLKPLDAHLKWSGENFDLSNIQATISAETASLIMGGALRGKDFTPHAALESNLELELNTFQIKGIHEAQLSLQQPAKLSLVNGVQAEIQPLLLSGPAGEAQINASITWPRQGNLQISMRELSSDLFTGFLTNPPPPAKLRLLHASAGWTNGPVDFVLQAEAEVAGLSTNLSGGMSNSPALSLFEKSSARVDLRGDQRGLAIHDLVVMASTGTVAAATGFLPVTLQPSTPGSLLQIRTNDAISLSLQTQPNSIFWSHLAQWTGVVLKQPEFSVDLGGTIAAPAGQAHLRAQHLEFTKIKTNMPAMDALEIDVVMDRNQARLENCRMLVQQQPVTLTAQMPLGPGFWEGLTKKQGPSWENATAHLRLEHASIAAFAKLFPALLAPQGSFDLDAEMVPGNQFRGEFNIQRARTRPLPSVGAIRDITMKWRFVERELELQEGTANIGGATVATSGRADLRGTEWLQGVPPPLRFSLRGTNVPLSRQPESIVRADLNLSVVKTNENPAVISGQAVVHDSYYLSDLTDLIPGKAASPRRRPPYFSIDVDPLASWKLAVNVKGERAFRVRSTLFNGLISLNLALGGTLKEPIALGEAKVDTGMVRFPFASLDVQQGFATLTSQNPYEPQLLVTAASKKFGYDVRMEMNGPADAPVIKFSSTPPLTSEELVLMLTAGEMPRGTVNLTPQQKAQTVALFLGKDLLAKLGFGDQSEERLTFSSGEEISEQGKPTYSIEYKLTDRWSIVGEYDRFNAYNAGLKWRVYSK